MALAHLTREKEKSCWGKNRYSLSSHFRGRRFSLIFSLLGPAILGPLRGTQMNMAYMAITILLAGMAAFSGVGKLRRDPKIVHVINEVVGVPMKYFPLLAACEIAAALGLVLGIWWAYLGLAAAAGLAIYFVGAIVSHLRVGDVKGIGPAVFLLAVSFAALALRILTR